MCSFRCSTEKTDEVLRLSLNGEIRNASLVPVKKAAERAFDASDHRKVFNAFHIDVFDDDEVPAHVGFVIAKGAEVARRAEKVWGCSIPLTAAKGYAALVAGHMKLY